MKLHTPGRGALRAGLSAAVLGALWCLLLLRPAAAEDIDLFVQAGGGGAPPNVLIVLDNTANWTTAFTDEIAALAATLNGLPLNADGSARFRVGLMLFTESGTGNSGTDGGYVRAAIRDLNAVNRPLYQALVSSLHVRDDKSNSGKLGKTMTDAWRYFSGAAPYSGNRKVKTDYTGNTAGGSAATVAMHALAGNALASRDDSPYHSPISAGGCAKNFIIYISNGAVQDNSADTSAATTELANAASAAGIAGATTAIPISPSGSQDNVGDEWARFLRRSELGIVTYTVDVNRVTTGQGPGWTALLKSMANAGEGRYFSVGSSGGGAQIAEALGTIFSEIQAVNSVFASVSLPVSVNTEGTYLNQVYVGMFRPDTDALPRWSGNLKQYKLGMAGSVLRTLDADGSPAINAATGFITECARSYWTPDVVDTYWAFSPRGGCLAIASSDASNYPDGNLVEKGGQAYRLRALTARTPQTCAAPFASCTSSVTFDSTSVTQAALGAASSTERDTLLAWASGKDIDDENLNAATTTEMRPSVHGDVVHSRPVAINYGNDDAPAVVVFYGANDGLLRAVNGNRSAAIGAHAAGAELWSFVPPEFDMHFKRLRDNTTTISYRGNTATSPAPQPKPYGFDGPVTAWQDDSHVWLYATMRRGGRVLYAFDVSNIASDPASPSLKWKRGCPNAGDDTGCSTGFEGLGQTWSQPKLVKAAGHGSGASPLLVMGGGYDPCEDADPAACSITKGNHVYVIDADDGSLLVRLDTMRAVTGDVFPIRDSSGLVQWLYLADLGGNVYRISGIDANTAIGMTPPARWTITRIAALGCDSGTGCTPQRKFLFSPDVLDLGGRYALLLGSGDREKPLRDYTSAYAVANHFYLLKDNPADAGWLAAESARCGAGLICLAALQDVNDAAAAASEKGWYLSLGPHEQVVTSAITVYGTVTFSTHEPAVPVTGACSSNLGTARVYNIDFRSAAPAHGHATRSEIIAGGGLPPSPVAGMVTLDDGRTVPFVIGSSPSSPLESMLPSSAPAAGQARGMVYWYIQQ